MSTQYVHCDRCGNAPSSHEILYAEKTQWTTLVDEDEDEEWGWTIHAIARCHGCRTVRFVLRRWDSSSSKSSEDGVGLESVEVFTEGTPAHRRPPGVDEHELPPKVAQMYRETLRACDADAHTLCGAGLRAIVEAICVDRGVTRGDLRTKIDALADEGHLGKKQTEHLHEHRYLGNAAIHQMEKPSIDDLEAGLQVIEGLLKTIYILPQHAESMKNRREARGAAKAAAIAAPVARGGGASVASTPASSSAQASAAETSGKDDEPAGTP